MIAETGCCTRLPPALQNLDFDRLANAMPRIFASASETTSPSGGKHHLAEVAGKHA
jgi:hypothetical protein